MRELLRLLKIALNRVCPSFLHLPENVHYPYLTLELDQVLKGLPQGPTILLLSVKVWSQYPGTKEILQLAQEIEATLLEFSLPLISLKLRVQESHLALLGDGKTRQFTLRLKLSLKEPSHDRI